jgi:hydroxyacyl-ACP dehydratase HTD2-like protein with hotdog domain
MLFRCANDNDSTPEKKHWKNVTYEVLIFEYTPDTGNNSSRFHYEIKYTNPNNVAIKEHLV